MHDVLRCIERCGEHQATLTQHTGDTEGLRERALDMLRDVEHELCTLAASFITAPMSGRMFTPLPHEYISEEERRESLYKQMQ